MLIINFDFKINIYYFIFYYLNIINKMTLLLYYLISLDLVKSNEIK